MTKKPFVIAFVPQKAGTDPSKPDDRKFINTHLSRLAADRRRLGRPRLTKTQPQADLTKAPKLQISRVVPKYVATVEHIERASQTNGTPTCESSPGAFTESSDSSNESDNAHDSTMMAVALQGNHDPFASTPIPITSQIHELLAFNSSMFTPWAIGIEKGDDKYGSFANKFAETSHQAMGERGTGYANLARLAIAAAAVTSNPRLEILAARFKMLAYKGLRESMRASGNQPNLGTLKQVFSLGSMEMAARQDDNSALHTRTLREFARSNPEAIRLDKKLLASICWHECTRCGLTGRRPILTVETFMDSTPYLRIMFEVKLRLEALGLWPTQHDDGFEAAKLNPVLLGRLREMRFIHDLSSALQYAPHFLDVALMEAYASRASLSCCNLIDSYNDALDLIRASHNPSDDLYQLYTESSIGVCGAYAIRAITSHEPIDIEPKSYTQLYKIYGTHGPVLVHLREALHYCRSADGLVRQAPIWLWLLWVASMAERAELFPEVTAEKVIGGHFHRAFVTHATATMGLATWEDVKSVAATFLRMSVLLATSGVYFDLALAGGRK